MLYGLNADYDEAKPLDTEQHACGSCGAELTTLTGAKKVNCESCGYAIEVGGGPFPAANAAPCFLSPK